MEPEGSLPHSHEPTYHLPSFRARLIQSAPYHPTSLLNILILPFHLTLGLPSGLFRVSPPNPVLFFFLPIRTTCLAHLLHHLITLIMCGEQHTSRSTPLHSFVRNSVAGTPTGYGLDGSRIESLWRTGFCAPVQTSPGVHPAPYTIGTGSFPGVKRPGCGVKHPTLSSAEVKEREKLNFFSPSGSSWHDNEVRHPRCVGSITKNFCVLHIQSNTTIFHPVVQ